MARGKKTATGLGPTTSDDEKQTVTLAEASDEVRREKATRRQRKAAAEAAAEAAAAGEEGPSGEGSQVVPKRRLVDRLRNREAVLDADGNEVSGRISAFPQLMAVKPRESISFHSDYYVVDGKYVSILGLFNDASGHEVLRPFWGVNRIPQSLGPNISVMFFEQVSRRSEKWISQHLTQSERLDRLAEDDTSGSLASSRRRANKIASDMFDIGAEVQNGASYLNVHNRMMVTAPSLEELDEAIKQIRDSYTQLFGTLNVAAYPGEQRRELMSLFDKNDKKRGRGFGFTSTEFAGAYSLFTNGFNDPSGEYLGYHIGDINSSAVMMDMNLYDSHVVVCDPRVDSTYPGRMYVSSLWCSKLSQSALVNGGRVVHLVLDNTDLDELGPKFENMTARIDMSSGDVNMFEFFGSVEDETALLSKQIEKIKLMAEQSYGSSDADKAIIGNRLSEFLTRFYTDQKMWYLNPTQNRHRLRLVSLPHDQVPLLKNFVGYLDNAVLEARQQKTDETTMRALLLLQSTFNAMLEVNSDLFNTHTSQSLDRTASAQRIVYDFGALLERGQGVAMAQLVNVIGFAVSDLRVGDTLIIHGADRITADEHLKSYLRGQVEELNRRGGRVVFSYNDMKKMLDDEQFNRLAIADYTILGSLTTEAMALYEKLIGTGIPVTLKQLIGDSSLGVSYVRRGVDNAVFRKELDLSSPTDLRLHQERERDQKSAAEAVRKISALRRRVSGGSSKTTKTKTKAS